MTKSSNKRNVFYQAQAILSRRDHAEAEMRQKLNNKGFSGEEVQEAVDWLYEKKLLNDEAFAKAYAASILRSKPVGPRWIEAKLRQRGVGSQDIETAIQEIYENHSEISLAREAAGKWRALHPNKENARQKLQFHLAQRGFSSHAISEALANA